MQRRVGAATAMVLGTAAAWAATGFDQRAEDRDSALTIVTGAAAGPASAYPAVDAAPPSEAAQASGPVDSSVTYADLVYYGTCWWQFQNTAGTTPSPALGNGYRNPQVIYDEYGDYFAGTVEKTDASGRVTDVILAFAAAATGHGPNPLADVTDNVLVSYGQSSPQSERAAGIYQRLFADPAYANARIHVTGLSLGSAWTQYVLGWSIATYGRDLTAARADFVHFGTPGWGQGIATHFGLRTSDFDGLIVGFNAKNDPTPANVPPGGLPHGQPSPKARLIGVTHWLADYQPYGPSPLFAVLNGLASHESWVYLAALGWPAWITPQDKSAAIAMITATQPPTAKIDPNYGTGGVARTVIGDDAPNRLAGTGADDVLQGRGGADVLTGGGGRNSYLYASAGDSTPAAPDLVMDFTEVDDIDLTGFGRPSGFTFVGLARPAAAGQVGYRYSGNETLVEVNVSGEPSAAMTIRLSGRHALSAANFRLGGQLSATAAYLAYQLLDATGDPFLDHVTGVPLT